MPDIATVHHDVALTNLSIAYRNTAMIAREISPEVLVRKQSDRYFIYDAESAALTPRRDLRAPGTEAAQVDFRLGSEAYFCDAHALSSTIPDEERLNADAPLQPEVDRVEFLAEQLLLNQEIALATTLANPDNDIFNGGDPQPDPWTDPDVDIAARIDHGRTQILQQSRVLANTLVLSHPVYTAIRSAKSVTDRVKYTRLGTVGPDELAQLFDVERVLVGRAMRRTEDASGSIEYVWGKDAYLLHVPKRASLKCISPTITFVWGQAQGTMRGWGVDVWREEGRKATTVRVQKYYQHRVVAPGAFYRFGGVVA